MPAIEEIDRAIAAHALWKGKLKSAIASGQTSLSVDQVKVDDRCEFGRWLHTGATPKTGKERDMQKEVMRLHADFHRVTGEVVKLVLQGKTKEAESMLGLVGAFGVASSKLTSAMMEWKRSAG